MNNVLLVRPYTDRICKYWRFKTLEEAEMSAQTIFNIFLEYRDSKDFVGMDMCRKFLEMGFTSQEDMRIIETAKNTIKMVIIPQEKGLFDM